MYTFLAYPHEKTLSNSVTKSPSEFGHLRVNVP